MSVIATHHDPINESNKIEVELLNLFDPPSEMQAIPAKLRATAKSLTVENSNQGKTLKGDIKEAKVL
jgi:hypothetical protein